jgi:hypothetical protein
MNEYGENSGFSGGMWRGMGKTDSIAVDLKKNEMYRQRIASRVAGVVVAGCERTMVSGCQWNYSLVLDQGESEW